MKETDVIKSGTFSIAVLLGSVSVAGNKEGFGVSLLNQYCWGLKKHSSGICILHFHKGFLKRPYFWI